MSAVSDLNANFVATANIVRLNAHDLNSLLSMRLESKLKKDVVDNHVYDIWARLLTTDIIKKAFEVYNVYIVRQAYWTLGWYQSSQEVIDVVKQSTLLGKTSVKSGEQELQVKRMRPNSELFVKVPDVANFPFIDYFVKNKFSERTSKWKDIDEFYAEEELIDSVDSQQKTALWYAVQDMISKDVDVRGRGLRVNKHPARIERVRFLLAKGANVRVGNDTYYVYYAAKFGILDLVKLMIDAGCDVNGVDNKGRTAIFDAEVEILGYLVDVPGINLNLVDNDGNNVIIYLIEEHKAGRRIRTENEMRLLVQKGANVNFAKSDGYTAIFNAVDMLRYSYSFFFEFLADSGANVNVVANDGNTPLIYFCFLTTHPDYYHWNNQAINTNDLLERYFNVLFKHGVDIRTKSYLNETVFFFWHANTHIFEFLINYTKEHYPNDIVNLLNSKNTDHGDTVLHILAQQGFQNMTKIQLLLENGADAFIMNDDEKTAVDIMGENLYEAVISSLPQQDA